MSELTLYRTDDGQAEVRLRAEGGSVWLTQGEIAERFGVTVPNANIHIRNILKEQELSGDSVIKESLITAADGKRYRTKSRHINNVFKEGELPRQGNMQKIHIAHSDKPVALYSLAAQGPGLTERPAMLQNNPELKGKTDQFWNKPWVGSISNERMKEIAHERYEAFDANRRRAETEAADVEDLRELEAIEKQMEREKK